MPKRGSCGSVLRCGLPPLEPMPTINPPSARWCTPRARRNACDTLVGYSACRHVRRLVLASRLSSRATPTRNSHSARCPARAKLPATSCLGAFWTPVATVRGSRVIPASKNLHNRRLIHRSKRYCCRPDRSGPELAAARQKANNTKIRGVRQLTDVPRIRH